MPLNILFLFPEDMHADCISAYGNPHIYSPLLDRLVDTGFSFPQNYCAGSDSSAVCVPSLAMLMSGKHWLNTNHELQGERTFPDLLRESGYTTFITGNWHNGGESTSARLRGRALSVTRGDE